MTRVYVFLFVASLAGCSSGEPMGRVSGRISFQGTPVDEGRVTFHDAERGIFIASKLDRGGRFEVQMAQGFGLPVGNYQVTVEPPLPELITGDAKSAPKREFANIPAKYRAVATTPFKAAIHTGDNPLSFDMVP